MTFRLEEPELVEGEWVVEGEEEVELVEIALEGD